ncbi:MAG: hypothetical protein WHU10_00060 [Fimbriimonadales bacterium]
MVFAGAPNPKIELVPSKAYSKDGRYAGPDGSAYAVYDAELGEGAVRPRPGLDLKWTPPGYDGTEIVRGACHGRYAANRTYALRVSGTSGVFRISDGSSSTDDIQWNAEPSEVAKALAKLSLVDSGDVLVYGRKLGEGEATIEFVGRYAGNKTVPPALSVTGSNTAGASLTMLVDGGLHERTVLAIAKGGTVKLYAVKPDWTYETLATGLSDGEYGMVQYGDSVYIANRTQGLTRYRLGGSYAGGQDPSQSPPPPPSGALSTSVRTLTLPPATVTVGATNLPSHVVHGAPVVDPNVLHHQFNITQYNRLDVRTLRHLELDFSSPVDLSQFPLWRFSVFAPSTQTRRQLHAQSLILKTSSGNVNPARVAYRKVTYNGGKAAETQLAAWFDRSQNALASVTGFRLEFYAYDVVGPTTVWMDCGSGGGALGVSVDVPKLEAFLRSERSGYAPRTVDVAMAYLSPAGMRGPVGAETSLDLTENMGVGATMTMQAFRPDNLTGWKAVPLRRHTDGSWRIVKATDGTVGATFDGSGVATRIDTWDDTDGARLETYTPSAIEANDPFFMTTDGAVGSWKGCLVVGSARKVWVSAVGDPQRYAPDPDDKAALAGIDPYDESQGVTFYASPNRAEDVLAVVGQDNLYVCTDSGVSVCAGDLPVDLTPPRRILGSSRVIGRPCGWQNGIVAPGQDGLFWHIAARGYDGIDPQAQQSANLLDDDPAAWEWLLGGGTPKAFATGRDLFVIAGTRGLWRDKNGAWTRMRFSAPQHSALQAGSSVLWVSDDGRIAVWSAEKRGSDYGAQFSWRVDYHSILGTRVALKEIKLYADVRADVSGEADGRPWTVQSQPGVYDVPAHAAPPCVEMSLSVECAGTMSAGHALIQGAFGGSKD